MAGGLFGKPFALNIKCIIFSLLIISLFLYKPRFSNNYILYGTLFTLFVISYVLMAWYDYFFDCRILPLRKGEYSWQSLIKPAAHVPNKQIEWDCEKDNNAKKILVYLFHIILITPLIAYVAVYKTKVNPIIYPILGVLAIFTLSYHGTFLLFTSHN